MLADAVGMALFVVLDTLPPAERLAFVLHDVFAVPFEQIAPIVERSPEATRKLASRARRRIHMPRPTPTPTWRPSRPSSTPSSPPGVPVTSTDWSPCWTPTCRCAATSARPGRAALGARGIRRRRAGPGLRGAGTRSPPRRRQRCRGRGDLRRRPGNRHHGFHRPRGTDRRDRRAGRSQAHRANRPASGDRLVDGRGRLDQRERGVVLQHPGATLVDEHQVLLTGAGNLGPVMATSALTAFGADCTMFETANCSGKFPSKALRRKWSASCPSWSLMPFSTRSNLVW